VGTYSVQVSGACNSVTNSATLSVSVPVSADALVSQTNCAGAAAGFSTVAHGTGPFGYQWFKDGNALSNQTNSSILIPSIGGGDAGTYSVQVSGACNSVTNSATLSVNAPSTAVITTYHSWSNSISVNNGIVEAIIVPTIGRVQQFRFLGETNNALWEDPTLYGQSPSTSTYKGWGGDKAWPAPQNSWNPTWPPANFDRMTNSGSFSNGIVTIVRLADSRFGIQATRTVQLFCNEPVMQVTTVFQRVATPSPSSLLSSNVAVWIDCQVNVSTNSRCYIPVPSPSIFANGYTLTGDAFFGPTLPPSYTQTNGLISFGPDTAASHKVGFDAGTLVLVGTNLSLRVDAPRVPGATYTAGGCSTAVYTGQYTTTPYFELELLSPAPTLAVGQTITFVTTYSLFHRTGTTTDAEAQKVLAWQY
jgi:hypothetical protein